MEDRSRQGLQTEVKIAFIDLLRETGFPAIECAGWVAPQAVLQLSSAEQAPGSLYI